MFADRDTPDETYWVEVGGNGRMHPYGMYKTVNRNDVEVVNCISDDDNHPKRWVLVRDGTHEAWVRVAERDKYGYELQPKERVSDAELEAISLKQAAIRDGSSISIDEARDLVDNGEQEQVRHALIALYSAAKTDPDVPVKDIDHLREIVHEHTGHVDTSHVPTVKGILNEVMNDHDSNDTT